VGEPSSSPKVLSHLVTADGANLPAGESPHSTDTGAAADASGYSSTDGRENGQWESRYPAKARKHILIDAIYVATVLLLTVVTLLLTWRGSAFTWASGDCTACSRATFDRYAYFCLGGLLGGTLFGLKFLYNAVAHGWWNIDRRLWRLLSPFLSAGLALAVGALFDAGSLGLTLKATSGAAYFSLGFVTGYFADSALRKMKDIAETVFGPPKDDGKKSDAEQK
jgi:hypothetical protein